MKYNRAVIYARVSTERQREKHTIDSQLSVLPEVIKRRGYIEVSDPYIDDGISGETISERPAMVNLLQSAEQGMFDAVFVVDLDRLTRARQSIDWEMIKSSLRKGNVTVITPGTEYNFNDVDQEFMSDIFSRVSAYEKKKILARMKRGKKEKARQGKFIGGKVLYGYTYNEDTKDYEVEESEAKVVHLIFDYCNQGLGIRQISQLLDKAGIPTPGQVRGYSGRKNKGWATSSVTNIIKNSAYAGEYKRWKYERVDRDVEQMRAEDYWLTSSIPAIIGKEEFEQAQSALKSRQAFSRRNSKRQYLLSGLIYCQSCGCKMIGECSRGKKELLYYVCHNGRRKYLEAECPIRSVRAEHIEEAVWVEITRLLKNPNLLKKAILEGQSLNSTKKQAEDLNLILNQKKKEKERLIDLYQYGKIERETLNNRIEDIAKEMEYIEKNLQSVTDNNKVDTRLQTMNELKDILVKNIDNFGYEDKRKVLEILLYGESGVGVYINKDFSVEIRGLIDFSKFNDFGEMEQNCGIGNTSLL